jgi:hypothetical protein
VERRGWPAGEIGPVNAILSREGEMKTRIILRAPIITGDPYEKKKFLQFGKEMEIPFTPIEGMKIRMAPYNDRIFTIQSPIYDSVNGNWIFYIGYSINRLTESGFSFDILVFEEKVPALTKELTEAGWVLQPDDLWVI